MRRKTIAGILLALIALPIVTAGCVKPLRVLTPELFGMTCATDRICVEDPTTFDRARVLRNDAVTFVQNRFGPLEKMPKVLFCASKECFSTFGHPEFAAQHVAGTGTTVINEIGWHDYILRHEMIHQWQQEQFGLLPYASGLPRWYIEGMAYELSEDPRTTIPNIAAQGFREEFKAWVAAGNDWRQPPTAQQP